MKWLLVGVVVLSFVTVGVENFQIVGLKSELEIARMDNAFLWSMVNAEDDYEGKTYLGWQKTKACTACRVAGVKLQEQAEKSARVRCALANSKGRHLSSKQWHRKDSLN